MPSAAWAGSQTFLEVGAVLVGIGSILSLIALLGDDDKKQVFPLGITAIAFGSVLTLAPAYERADNSVYWKVIAGIAGLALGVAAIRPLRRLLSWFRAKPLWTKPSHSENIDREDQQEQSQWPVRADVNTELHHSNIEPSTISTSDKSLAIGAVTIAVGLMLLAKGARLLLRGHDRSPG